MKIKLYFKYYFFVFLSYFGYRRWYEEYSFLVEGHRMKRFFVCPFSGKVKSKIDAYAYRACKRIGRKDIPPVKVSRSWSTFNWNRFCRFGEHEIKKIPQPFTNLMKKVDIYEPWFMFKNNTIIDDSKFQAYHNSPKDKHVKWLNQIIRRSKSKRKRKAIHWLIVKMQQTINDRFLAQFNEHQEAV